jgi:multidrug efflux system membrane fusion protein
VNKRLKIILGVVAVLLALGTTIYWTRWKDVGAGPGAGGWGGRRGGGPPVAVRLATASPGAIDVVIEALGTVTARNTAIVKSRADGPLIKINFAEGHEVKAGDVLAEIDPRPFKATLEQAQGQLARDEAQLAIAKSDLGRYQVLLKQDSIASQQVEDQAALVHQYEGTVKADRGTVENARLNVEFTHVTAPIAGRVGLRLVDLGNIVHAADATGIVTITETRPIFVVFAVPAESMPDIDRKWRAGASLKVEAFDRDGKTLLATGRLESTDNAVDTTTSTVKLKAVFDNKDGALFPNQFVNARLTLDTLDKQILVPSNAVQRGTPGTFVYRVNDDSTVSIKVVKVGIVNGDRTAILDGLAPGDRIVIEGTDKLREGSKVDAATDAPTNPGKGPRKGGWGGGKPGDKGAGGNGGPPGGKRRDQAGNAQ